MRPLRSLAFLAAMSLASAYLLGLTRSGRRSAIPTGKGRHSFKSKRSRPELYPRGLL